MAGLNRIQLIGRLGIEPKTKTTPNGKQVCTFRVAVDRRWGGKSEGSEHDPDWFNVEAWGRLGEICQQYLHKGRLVFLEGRLQTDRYEKEGVNHNFTKVVAQQMQMLDRRTSDEADPALEPETLAAEV